MKKIENFNDIKVNNFEEFKKIVPGAYPVIITETKDVPEKEYLIISFEISAGEFIGYYGEMKRIFGGEWKGIKNCSYKETALPFFKGTMTAIEKSNSGYIWDWNEKSLIGKKAIMVYQEEDWEKDDEIITTVKPFRFASLEEYKEGIKIPTKKTVSASKTTAVTTETKKTEVADKDLPF